MKTKDHLFNDYKYQIIMTSKVIDCYIDSSINNILQSLPILLDSGIITLYVMHTVLRPQWWPIAAIKLFEMVKTKVKIKLKMKCNSNQK